MNGPEENSAALSNPPDEKPPVFRTWPGLYAFVLIDLAALIFLFWLFTLHYAPAS